MTDKTLYESFKEHAATTTEYVTVDNTEYLLTDNQGIRACKALGLDPKYVGNMRWIGNSAIVYETLILDVPLALREELGNA